jgi:hypothetical protein
MPTKQTKDQISRRVTELGASAQVASAITAVLDLKPPTRHPDDDPGEYALLTEGWLTAMGSVTRVLADRLEVRT